MIAKTKKAMHKKPRHAAASKAQPPRLDRCPIIAIGASAGGLEAFEGLFHHLPPDSGMAFVLVPHLDPEHESILTEILGRATEMPVVEAGDGMRVDPNRVYVIPPNRDMAIFHRALRITFPDMPRGQRMPIDSFMRSLADEQGAEAIGVLLSGTGTDGTLGLRAIHGAGGISFVQDPATAKFDGMPVSAINSGVATFVLPVEKIPSQMQTCIKTMSQGTLGPSPSSPPSLAGLGKILLQLRSGTGHDFSQYKATTISRRIERRMTIHGIEEPDIYARYLKERPAEVRLLFKELLINVTNFFRDPEAFAALKESTLPQIFKDKRDSRLIRIWVPACATGEEAYSLAMLFREYMDESGEEYKVQIYSTDLDEDTIRIARSGAYPPNIAMDVSPARLRRFFLKQDSGYRVKNEIRETIVFAVQDVIKDPPFTKLDLVSCRNLLIYIEPEVQHKIIAMFHYALRPGGILFLSPSESIGNHTALFTPVSRKWKICRASTSAGSLRGSLANPLPWTAGRRGRWQLEAPNPPKQSNLAELTFKTLVQSFAPASVVIDEEGSIVFVHGDTGRFLRPAPGQATLSVVEMARDGLQIELRNAIHKVVAKQAPVTCRGIALRDPDGVPRVDVSVRKLKDLAPGQGLLLVSFQESASQARGRRTKSARVTRPGTPAKVAELEQDIARIQASLEATIEEQQASNEELKSANEELQSTNEEMQSTNEELETSKEELQSVNEELTTVNAELQAKIEQLVRVQNDVKNLLDNTNIGTIFLDRQLVIKGFNRDIKKVFRIVDTDVGRPLADIKPNFDGVDLIEEAGAVLESLLPREHEVETAQLDSFLVRIAPYRTFEDVIDGAVMTFTDITKRKVAETALHESTQYALGVTETIREPLLVLDADLRVLAASRSFFRVFQTTSEETVGRPLHEMGRAKWDVTRLKGLLDRILTEDEGFEDFELSVDLPHAGRKKMLLNARRVLGREGQTKQILLALEDITHRNVAHETQSES